MSRILLASLYVCVSVAFSRLGSSEARSDQSTSHSTSDGDPYSIIWMHAIQSPYGKLIASNWKTFQACPDLRSLLSIVNLLCFSNRVSYYDVSRRLFRTLLPLIRNTRVADINKFSKF